MARAAHGPGDDEWTLILEPPGDEVLLVKLLNDAIEKIERRERRRRLTDSQWLEKDVLERMRSVLLRAKQEYQAFFTLDDKDTSVQ